MFCFPTIISIPNKLGESPCKITTKPAAAEVEEDTESQDQTYYEVIEMQVTSSAKTRYAPTQTPQESTVTQPTESEFEANKDFAAQEENQEAYVNFD